MIAGHALAVLGVVVIIIAGGLAWYRFRATLRAHRARVRRGSRVLPTAFGLIELAIAGEGAPVLLSHGVGGGFDQLEGRRLFAAGFRVIAPSRFGYLRSPSPEDPSPERQAATFAALLDELGIDRVSIVGVSVGALSALQFAARYPKRCRALVVVVPVVTSAGMAGARVVSSDFLYWLGMTVTPESMIRHVLATNPFVVAATSPEERRRAHDLLWNIMPIGERTQGLLNDRRSLVAARSIAFERIEAPTLVAATKDDTVCNLEAARAIAAGIPGARLITYRTGGHFWIGHDAELFDEVLAFLAAIDRSG